MVFKQVAITFYCFLAISCERGTNPEPIACVRKVVEVDSVTPRHIIKALAVDVGVTQIHRFSCEKRVLIVCYRHDQLPHSSTCESITVKKHNMHDDHSIFCRIAWITRITKPTEGVDNNRIWCVRPIERLAWSHRFRIA